MRVLVPFVVLAVVDISTSPDLSFLGFYFLPMLLAAWYFGRREAMAMALASAGVWLADDLLSHRFDVPTTASVWNRSVEIVFFVLLAWLAGTLRATLLREIKARAELLERDLELAREGQMALLPPSRLEKNGFTAAAVCRQTRGVGGDAYDTVPLGKEAVACAVADVCGKGISAALLMAGFLADFRALLLLRSDRLDLLATQLSARLKESLGPRRFVSAFLAVVEDGWLRYVNAGHEPGLLFTPGHPEAKVARLGSTGPVLGPPVGIPFREERVPFPEGGVLLLYTDGLTEAANAAGEEFGRARVVGTAAGALSEDPDTIVCRLLRAAEEHSAGETFTDDATILCLAKRSAAGRHPEPSIELRT